MVPYLRAANVKDGYLDLSVTDGYGPEGGHFVFRNEMSEPGRTRGLSVLVLDEHGHFTKPGAEVRVFGRKGALLATRMVTTGGGYNSQSAIPVHFGLMTQGPVDVEVIFMTAEGRKAQKVRHVKLGDWAGSVLEIREGN